MKKIRINELARELEVKPGVILDMLPGLGVQEKKTHSSSVDEDVAIELRRRLVADGSIRTAEDRSNGNAYDSDGESDQEHEFEPVVQTPSPERPAESSERLMPAATSPQATEIQEAKPQPQAPVVPAPVIVEQEAPAALAAAAESERPVPTFRPLRPPLTSGGGGAIHPPLAQSSSQPLAPGPVNRNISIPARPLPPSPRPGLSAPMGPRQPLPAQPARSASGVLDRPARPAPGIAPPPPSSASPAPQQPYPNRPSQMPPTHVVAPGPVPGAASASSSMPAPPAAASVPGAPIPPRAAPPRPSAPGLTPGAPIAPRPPGARPLVGQPQLRPTVPPRPDLVQRLKQQQMRPSPAAPSMPRPGAPARPSPAPGQPLYRGPIRPGQPLMRGPGQPLGPSQPGLRRPGGLRPMHPTSLRPETATPPPTEQQRRHQAKPGTRQTGRRREAEEGNLRERVSKRPAAYVPPPIDREITVAEGVTVKELSEKLGVKANLVIKKLVEKKIFATINQTLDVKLAEELAREFGASTNQVSYEQESTQDVEQAEETKDLVRRAPVVTIMGHVDHGKTSLLDAIRETNVAGREAGGITQHIGAYYIERNGRKIVFIDTPGHQAFTRMRARGAKVTDIVVLVVSADDGVMPQTLEAIDHAKAAGVPIIVAINKIDKPDAQPDRVKQQLSDRGLLAEDWGGDVVMVPVSAKAKQNLDLLLEMILLVADIQDLKANPARPAVGTILEAKLDRGRGPVATMLVRNGTLRVGDFFICGSLFNKVRAMFDDRGNPVKEAEPSMPVEVIGLESLPEVGDNFQAVSDTSKAKQIVIYRESKARDAAMARGARVATLDSLSRQFKKGDLKDLNLIIKADVGGTAEVLSDTLQQLSNEKVRVRILRSGVGAITEDDVLLASASEAVIVGFNVKPERSAQATADQQRVDIRLHSIIYELIDEITQAMTGLLEPVYKETIQGHAEVRETFKISKVGTVAGCFVSDGSIRRDSQVRLKRGNEVVHTGKIEALKRFKNDASEVKNGVECGISLANFNAVQAGDVIEAFTMQRVAAELPQPVAQ
ncbi:MAG TPA: translation initiation factor IF-2 [Bryobacteraceae bacterium]|nr:translation initiation factor IF-2 [Bryobacteraceae bacterium]